MYIGQNQIIDKIIKSDLNSNLNNVIIYQLSEGQILGKSNYTMKLDNYNFDLMAIKKP